MAARSLAVCALIGTAQALTVSPKPTSTAQTSLMGIAPEKFAFAATGGNSGHLRDAFNRYYGIIFHTTSDEWMGDQELKAEFTRHGMYAWETVEGMDVNVMSNDTTLDLDTDESYTLTIQAPRAKIEANSVYGAMHGLESFSQLVERGSLVNGTVITDKPRYAFRAVMIDTARHFYHKEVIFQHLDAMAYAKMNVLHWHLVDSDAFPFQSTTFPMMSQTGAYSPNHVYTHHDVKEVINYAGARGIRVLPEFDTPGHVLKGWESTGLLTDCYAADGTTKTGTGPLNPTLNETYTYLASFYAEIHKLFPDKFVHVGGDEVPAACWQSNPQVTKWMKEQDPPLTSFADLETLYEQKLLDILKDQGTSYMVWQEIFDNGAKIAKDTVIDVWKGGNWQEEMAKVTAAGFHTVLSAPFYLNYISYGDDWKKYYTTEPSNFTGGEAATKAGLVGGVEACFWSEYIDATNFIARAWPRTMSIAERGWSSKETTDTVDAFARFHEWRCKLLSRGINAEPLEAGTHCPKEFTPNYVAPWE